MASLTGGSAPVKLEQDSASQPDAAETKPATAAPPAVETKPSAEAAPAAEAAKGGDVAAFDGPTPESESKKPSLEEMLQAAGADAPGKNGTPGKNGRGGANGRERRPKVDVMRIAEVRGFQHEMELKT